MQALEPGDPRRIGRFTLEGRLGAGGMGRVYLGRSASGRWVAVKCVHRHLLDDDPTFRDRFRREVAAARAVGGFWTPAIVDSDADAEQPWYASAYVDAPTLHDVVRRHGLLGLPAAAALGAGLAEALAAIHAAGLVHRDLKPSNVLMADDGPRVIDFGIVRAAQDGTALTGTGVRLLSLGYSPPEQMRGQAVTAASDVFALGVVLVFATTGRLPYPGATEVAVDRRMDAPPDLDGVPGPLIDVLRRCLAVDPAARPSVADLLAAFNRLVELDTQPVAPARRPGPPPRPTRLDPDRAEPRPVDPPPRWPPPEPHRGIVHRAAESPADYARRAAEDAARERAAAPTEPPVVAPDPDPPAPPGPVRLLLGALLPAAVTALELHRLGGFSVPTTALLAIAVLVVGLLAVARHQGDGGMEHEGGRVRGHVRPDDRLRGLRRAPRRRADRLRLVGYRPGRGGCGRGGRVRRPHAARGARGHPQRTSLRRRRPGDGDRGPPRRGSGLVRGDGCLARVRGRGGAAGHRRRGGGAAGDRAGQAGRARRSRGRRLLTLPGAEMR